MEKIPSFTVDHLRLLPGVYVSRKDRIGDVTLTTFDVRMTAPNREPVMSTGVCHTLEHLIATYLRNDPVWASKDIYWGPMGCRTGFYLILAGDLKPLDIQGLLLGAYRFAASFEGEIPGAHPKDCGNYSDMDLEGAKAAAARFIDVLVHLDDSTTCYP
ncbi:MAG: S-ribosylhomocysteine lyase [Clostridiales bacterium]|nr:S-ribosylhomocysteine lyase [Clostridiales bacterium]